MPAWLTESVIYEINTATFSSAGNFASVTERLGYLQDLGVNLLWLMPIQPLGVLRRKPPFGSQYAIRDYYGINPDYGNKDDLHRLIDSAHTRGMRVIIDIVANHTSWDSVLMEHPGFYHQDSQGHPIQANPDWSDVAGLNYDNPDVRTYMIAMLQYWLREFHLDGFRCDVAGLVPTFFWEQARPELEKVKPDLVMLAEWDQPDLLRRAFDIDYSWAVYKTMKAAIAGDAPASDIRKTWEEQKARYQPDAPHLRFFDNHDEQRAINLFGLDGAKAASVLMFTLDGVPMVYNGTEVGDSTESGSDAMFWRLKVFWPIEARRPDFLPFYKSLIALRRNSKTLQKGALEWLDHSADEHAVVFRRHGEEELLVAVNLRNQPVKVSLRQPAAPGYRQLFGAPASPDGTFELKAWGSAVWAAPRS